jgi:hypothetical protein
MSPIDKPAALERFGLVVGALALVVAFWPVVPQITARVVRMPAAPTLPTAGSEAAADRVREQIVAGNLFSASRRAPRERFVAPGQLGSSLPEASAMPEAGADTAGETGPQLYGIMTIDGAARALLQVAADSTPRLVAEGDRIGGWRVRRIAADRVELSSSSGTRVVRLSRRTLPDSAEYLP